MHSSQSGRTPRSAKVLHVVAVGAMFALLVSVVPGSVDAGASTNPSADLRRLYLAYFDREPDAVGAGYWLSQHDDGMSIATISSHLASSEEFRSRYGDLDDAAFIDRVYQNVLGRQPEREGRDYWRQRLADGMTRGTMMVHLADSPEWRRATQQAGGASSHGDGSHGSGGASPSPADGTDFVERFDGNRGLDRFRSGVFHRDVDVQGHGSNSGSWPGDHDMSCGEPTTSRTITKANRRDALYMCRDHMMTSIGHVDGYSVAWFSPDQVFDDQRTVSWDVNSTDLGTRQWWEVAIVPSGASDVSCIDFLPCDLPSYPAQAVVVGNRDNSVRVWANGHERDATWETICKSDQASLDPDGCASKAIRRPWSVTDNGDGTLTISYHVHRWTVPGSFPDGPFKVVFKDHSYTPLKDGPVVGFTWHWDNVIVR